MANHRATYSKEEAKIPVSGAHAHTRQKSSHRNSLCAQNRHRLGRPALRNGLWFWHDLLATPAGLAENGRMGQNTQGLAEPIATSRANRFFPRSSGFRFCASCFWGAKTGPNPTDRRKKGSKHHLVTDANGIPLSVKLTGANRHDVTQLLPLVDSIPPIAGKVGRPLQRPDSILGDRGYDSQPHRRKLRKRGIMPQLAKRRTDNGSGLGIYRWVIERSLSWLHQNRRLRIRYERRDDIHEAFLKIGCIKICWNHLINCSLC
jgi:transposase